MPDNIPEPQAVCNPISRSAIFLVATVARGEDKAEVVRSWCGDIAALVRAVGTRAPTANLSCVCGFGAEAWDMLFGAPRPAALHPFREFGSGDRRAIATPGDILLHIRADHMDLCFELASHMLNKLGDAVTVVDEVHGFRYFDLRDMVGFVDGTENPTGKRAETYTIIGDEDAEFAGGSYVIVQKYLHNLNAWNGLTVEQQELIIGREKLSDVELDDSIKPSCSHSSLTTIEENGEEVKILRHNMAFGPTGRERVRHVFHRLCAHAASDRADARKHVRRKAAGQLRPPARLQPRGDGRPLLRAVQRSARRAARPQSAHRVIFRR